MRDNWEEGDAEREQEDGEGEGPRGQGGLKLYKKIPSEMEAALWSRWVKILKK